MRTAPPVDRIWEGSAFWEPGGLPTPLYYGEADPPPPNRRQQTDIYENITFPQLRLRAVKMVHKRFLFHCPSSSPLLMVAIFS